MFSKVLHYVDGAKFCVEEHPETFETWLKRDSKMDANPLGAVFRGQRSSTLFAAKCRGKVMHMSYSRLLCRRVPI